LNPNVWNCRGNFEFFIAFLILIRSHLNIIDKFTISLQAKASFWMLKSRKLRAYYRLMYYKKWVKESLGHYHCSFFFPFLSFASRVRKHTFNTRRLIFVVVIVVAEWKCAGMMWIIRRCVPCHRIVEIGQLFLRMTAVSFHKPLVGFIHSLLCMQRVSKTSSMISS
jgi:hypothetical protein